MLSDDRDLEAVPTETGCQEMYEELDLELYMGFGFWS